MAEGDTIHRTARRLERALSGRTLVLGEAPAARSPLRLQPGRLSSLVGSCVTQAEARGKHLLLHFSNELALHCHQGMSGSWLVRQEPLGAGGRVPWMALRTESGAAAYQFGGPILRLLSAGELRRDRRLRQLGPDILGSDFTAATGVRALRAAAADRAIGDALLDQHLIAGIGNIYKSEALWDAGVVPQRPIGELSGERLESVVDAAMSLMREAVITGRQPKRIYRRVGMPCPRCGETIRSGGQGDANRMSYWCPRCQR